MKPSLYQRISQQIARNTQLYLQEETKITKTVDPWAGIM
jgi:methylmalonyl-CoA mutase